MQVASSSLFLVPSSSSSSSSSSLSRGQKRRRDENGSGGGGGGGGQRFRLSGLSVQQAIAEAEAEEGNDIGDGDDDDSSSEDWGFCDLPTRQQEHAVLGEPGERSKCFGCVFIGERDTTSIDVVAIRNLVETARMAMGRADMVSIAKSMARQYESYRRKTNRNIIGDEKPLPAWPAAQILDHLRNHHQDPEMQQVVMLSEIQELRTKVLSACLKKNKKTKKVMADKDQVAAYEKLVKLQIHVQKQDPSKMVFYSAGAHVDPTNQSQGVISYKTKNMHSDWKHRRRR